MKIGQLSQQAQCKIDTVRYYEKIGLLGAPSRSPAGYRQYEELHVRRLSFIRRCRELGFSIEEIRKLLSLVDNNNVTCLDIKTITLEHLKNIRRKMSDLKKLEKSLAAIAAHCSDDAAPECPIIDALFEEYNGRDNN